VIALAQLQDAETAAELARADLDAATFNRRYASIVAASAGVILSRSAEPGEMVSPGAEILVLGSRARGTVFRAGLSDRDVVRIAHGDGATVEFDAVPGRTFEGTVTEIGSAARAGTGTYTVEVSIRDGRGLAAGLVGTVRIEPRQGLRATMVPIEAVLEADGDAATVFVLSGDGGTVERRRIRLARLDGGRVAVVAGLAAGERVITEGAAYLDDGAKVRVVQ
jgi:RND family efflux transporter MFP subunit